MSNSIGIKLLLFDKTNFGQSLGKILSSEAAESKKQIQYLTEYLEDIGTRTVVLECTYTDRVLQKDYLAYQADDSITAQYRRGRLHFFSKPLLNIPEAWDNYLDNEHLHILSKTIKENSNYYLGCMVVVFESPDFIASTYLKVPDFQNKENRHTYIPATRAYNFNLLGTKLHIEDTLGFMEQDSAVSECATCSVWSTTQKTSVEYGHEPLTPGQITARALGENNVQNGLPEHKGLNPEDVQRFFRSIPQMNSFVFSPSDGGHNSGSDYQTWSLYAILDWVLPMLDHGMPIILCLKEDGGGNECHAICVTGYQYTDGKSKYESLYPQNDTQILATKSSKITGLIVHDDNIGPFVRYSIDADKGCIKNDYSKKAMRIDSAICAAHSSVRIYPHKEIREFLTNRCKKHNLTGYIMSPKIWKSNQYKEVAANNLDKEYTTDNKELNKLIALVSMNMPEYIYVASYIKTFDCRDRVDNIFSITGPWKYKFLGSYKIEY